MECEVCKTGIFLTPCYLTPASKKCMPYNKICYPIFGSPLALCCALNPEQCLNTQNNLSRKGPTGDLLWSQMKFPAVFQEDLKQEFWG